jgi:hypothetical protein
MGTLQDFAPMPWCSTANQDLHPDSGRAAFLDIIPGNVYVRSFFFSSNFFFPLFPSF